MSEQLRDLLVRVADEAGPGRIDPSLWPRARRARRRERAVAASAFVVAVLAVLVSTLAVTGALRSSPPPPVERPERPDGAPGIPSLVEGVSGTGGLRLEKKLAVGPASVAIANPHDAFVITAGNGVVHRLALPGFHAELYDEGMPGLALSPDGTKLVYGWHREPDAGEVDLPSGARVVDLTNGRIRTLDHSRHRTVGTPFGSFTSGFRWSPDSRYLAYYDNLTADLFVRGGPGCGGSEYYARLVDTTTGDEVPIGVGPLSHGPGCPPYAVSSAGLFAAHVDDGIVLGKDGRRAGVVHGVEFPGRFNAEGSWLLTEEEELGGLGSVVPAQPNSRDHELTLSDKKYPYGAHVVPLSWIDEEHVLALLYAGISPTRWTADGDLVVVTMDQSPAEAAAESLRQDDADVLIGVRTKVVGKVTAGDTGSAFSFATDFASLESPTRGYQPPPRTSERPAADAEESTSSRRTSLVAGAAGLAGLMLLGLLLWHRRARAARR